MAQITITIPDAIAPRVLNGFAKAYGYQATIDGQPNPQTKAQFCKAKLLELIKQAVKATEGEVAEVAARLSAHQDIDNNITLS